MYRPGYTFEVAYRRSDDGQMRKGALYDRPEHDHPNRALLKVLQDNAKVTVLEYSKTAAVRVRDEAGIEGWLDSIREP